MSIFNLTKGNALYYEHFAPLQETGMTYVFFNALTSDTEFWEANIAPSLRKAGHGTLTFNYRGQTNSPFSDSLTLNQHLIVDDAQKLLKNLQPKRPLFVGLSIGGLFATQALLSGTQSCGLVLVNTLRQNSMLLQWIGDALVKTVSIGGLDLFRDLYLPLLMGASWQNKNRKLFLKESNNYTPLNKKSGHFKLLAEAGRTSDWDIKYEDVTLPCLVITGRQDHVFLDLDVLENLFLRLPKGTRRDYHDAGHLLPTECPKLFVQDLLHFAEEVKHGSLA